MSLASSLVLLILLLGSASAKKGCECQHVWCWSSVKQEECSCFDDVLTFQITACNVEACCNFCIGDCSTNTTRFPSRDRQLRSRSTSKVFHSGGNEKVAAQDRPEFRAVVDQCGALDYMGRIYVDEHIYALASPGPQAVAAGCPFVAVHSVQQKGNPPVKEFMIWNDVQYGEDQFDEAGSMPIGTFQLSDLAQAYADSEGSATAVATRSAAYDVVTNNCGKFMVDLASALNVKIDVRITSFVTRRLLEHAGKELADSIRNSLDFFSLFQQNRKQGGDEDRDLAATAAATSEASDEQVIEILVETTASGGLN